MATSTPSFEEVPIPFASAHAVEVRDLALSSSRTDAGRELFVVPVELFSFDGEVTFQVALITKEPDGPIGPGGPAAGGWAVEIVDVGSGLSSILYSAVIDGHLYLADQSKIVELDLSEIGSPEFGQRLVFELQVDPIAGLAAGQINSLLVDEANDRLLTSTYAGTLNFVSTARQQFDPGVVVDAAVNIVEVSGDPIRHVHERSADESLVFSSGFGRLSVVDIADSGSSETIDVLDSFGTFYGALAGVGETLVTVERTPGTLGEDQTQIVVYDLTGWVAPESIVDMPAPLVGGVQYVAPQDGDPQSAEPWCTVNVGSMLGYCFATTVERETYIATQLLGVPDLGDIWIGRFDEEVVAP